MMKLLGAVFVLFAATAFGFYQSLQYSRRPKQIRELLQALGRLETEIQYGATPLPEALRSAAKPLSPPVAALFEETALMLSEPAGTTAAEAWRLTVERRWPATAMKTAERQIVEQLGHTLGVTDQEGQLKQLRLASGHLGAEEASAREDQKRYASMWKSLGVLGGALVVVLMY